MRPTTAVVVALLFISGPACATARADGGRVRVSEVCGDLRITVFTSPNPLRAGRVDVSALVQDATSGRSVPDVDVRVELTPLDGGTPPIRAVATRAAATNKLLHSAIVQLPSGGAWAVRVECITDADEPLAVQFTMDAGPPLPPWLSVWPWYSWPIAVVLLFGAHRALVARQARRRR